MPDNRINPNQPDRTELERAADADHAAKADAQLTAQRAAAFAQALARQPGKGPTVSAAAAAAEAMKEKQAPKQAPKAMAQADGDEMPDLPDAPQSAKQMRAAAAQPGGAGAASAATQNAATAQQSTAGAASRGQAQADTAGQDASARELAARRQSSRDGGGDSSSGQGDRSRDQSTPRLDPAAIVPSFPAPAPPPGAVASPHGGPGQAGFTPAMIQQMVQFAAVGRTADGQSQFRLGFHCGPLAGVQVALTAVGKRRVRLRFTGVSDSDSIGETEVNQLVQTLASRNVEVVDVEMD